VAQTNSRSLERCPGVCTRQNFQCPGEGEQRERIDLARLLLSFRRPLDIALPVVSDAHNAQDGYPVDVAVQYRNGDMIIRGARGQHM